MNLGFWLIQAYKHTRKAFHAVQQRINFIFLKFMTFRLYLYLTFVGLLLIQSSAFIIEAKQSDRKCFRAEQSPDKTLEVKFGFPRRQKQNCDVHFSIELTNEDEHPTTIYSDMHKCHEMHPGEPHVIKHTSESMSMEGSYEICYNVMQNTNEQLLLEIFIGERINPLLYSEGEDVLPLIQAQELIELDLKIQNIRKSLGWSRKLLNESNHLGDSLQASLNQLNDFSVNATLLQICFLSLYGVAWILFMRQQKIN